MVKTNQGLALASIVLLLGSVFVYRHSVVRTDRFERGQELLPNLNPDEVSKIVIRDNEETVTLSRRGDSFVVEEADGYLAKNEAVNRLLRDLLEIGLEKEVGRGEELEAELELEPKGESGIELTLINSANKEMVRLRAGRSFAEGPGRYVQRLDQDSPAIYLTSRSLQLNASPDWYLKKEIVTALESEIQSIQGRDFLFDRQEGGDLELAAVPSGRKVRNAEASSVRSILNRLSFEKVYPADAEEVRGLLFEQALRIELRDSSGYLLFSASEGDRTFLRIEGFHTVERVEIAQDTPEEELQEKAEILSRAEEIDNFNTLHGSWIYELSDYTAKKLQKRKADLIEKA